jgi:protein-S-isoprenylcysteine O-methyltransferase Ste14
MTRMTPEQEAAYALDFGVARTGLSEAAQLAYDRLAEERAIAAQARLTQMPSAPVDARMIPPRLAAALGTALVFLVGQGGGVVLLPYALTRWRPGVPQWPVVVQVIGIALITVAGIVVLWGFARFATEGVGVPFPGEPSARKLTVGGPYRYVRNPLYLAIVMAISGQALLFSRPVLLAYAAVLLVVFVALVQLVEDPALARRFGPDFEAYRQQVPAWWPRLPRRTS